MKNKIVCCDLTEKVTDLEAWTAISSDFRFRLEDLPKKNCALFFSSNCCNQLYHCHYSPLIPQSVTRSKWNMGEICGLFMICTYITKKNYEILPCSKKVILITEFGILCKNPPFYEVKMIFQKRLCTWRNFKIIFSRPLFTIIFKPKILILDTYSILTR